MRNHSCCDMPRDIPHAVDCRHAAIIEHGYQHPYNAQKRTAYYVVIRRMVTGTEWRAVLFLRDPGDALASMSKRVPLRERNWLRLISCELATDEQVQVHRARLASL